MQKKIFFLLLIAVFQTAQCATFSVYNLSGRDVFVKAFWLTTTPLAYVKLPAGKSISYNSGLHSIEKIRWITDMPNNNKWVAYTLVDQKKGEDGKVLDALKVNRQIRIYPSGQYEHNFGSSSIMSTASGQITNDSFWVGNTEINLVPKNDPFLVVENNTNGLILITLPVGVTQAERGLTSSGLDCIAPGGSRIYYVGTYIPQASGVSINSKNISCHKQNQTSKGWSYSTYLTTNIENSGSARTIPGKIRILDNDIIKYTLAYNGKEFIIAPTSTAITGTPAQCQ